MIQAVLFDLDGTLTNTIDDIATAMNRALRLHGLPGWENLYVSCGAENVTITQATGLDEVVGHTVAEAAEMLKCEPDRKSVV